MIKNIEKLSLTHYVGLFNIHKADNCPPGFFSVQAVYLFATISKNPKSVLGEESQKKN